MSERKSPALARVGSQELARSVAQQAWREVPAYRIFSKLAESPKASRSKPRRRPTSRVTLPPRSSRISWAPTSRSASRSSAPRARPAIPFTAAAPRGAPRRRRATSASARRRLPHPRAAHARHRRPGAGELDRRRPFFVGTQERRRDLRVSVRRLHARQQARGNQSRCCARPSRRSISSSLSAAPPRSGHILLRAEQAARLCR